MRLKRLIRCELALPSSRSCPRMKKATNDFLKNLFAERTADRDKAARTASSARAEGDVQEKSAPIFRLPPGLALLLKNTMLGAVLGDETWTADWISGSRIHIQSLLTLEEVQNPPSHPKRRHRHSMFPIAGDREIGLARNSSADSRTAGAYWYPPTAPLWHGLGRRQETRNTFLELWTGHLVVHLPSSESFHAYPQFPGTLLAVLLQFHALFPERCPQSILGGRS